MRANVLIGFLLSLGLLPLIPSAASGQVAVAISPNQTNVPAGGALPFTATVTGTSNTAVTWSVLEAASGGKITSGGLYTAPAYAGTFHVVATSQADASKSATALVVVPGFLAPDVRVETGSPTATLLQNGKVLLAGGGTVQSAVSSSAQLYDPVTNTFALTSSMTAARQGHAAALLAGGQVLIAGGASPSLATAELYDPLSGTFTATGNMEVPRGGLTATTLQNGQVLVTGGANCPASCVVANTAELYIPGSGTFVPTGNTNVQRTNHTAILLQNGKVLIAGGNDPTGNPIASTELYNPASGVFTLGPAMTTARTQFAAALLPNGQVLLAGGSTATNIVGTAEIYDPATNTITPTGSLNLPRYGATAAPLSNGQVLIAGGAGIPTLVANAELFNPATGTFALTGTLNVPRFAHTETLLPNGQVLIAGGADTGLIESAELYNPASGLFTTKTVVLKAPRTFHTQTTLADGRILVTGGINCPAFPCFPFNSAEIYDPAVGQFAFTANLGSARFAHTATLLNNRQVLIVGGWSAVSTATDAGQAPLSTAELYDPVANAFSATGSLVTARGYHAATLLPNGNVLITGGQGAAGDLSSAEIYDPATGTFSAIGNMASARFLHTATLLNTSMVLLAGGEHTVPSPIGPTPAAQPAAELFNPATGLFAPAGQMIGSPGRQAATLLGNGRVLIGSQYYDPTTGQFAAAGLGPGAEAEDVAALLPNGQVLLAGASSGDGPESTYIYDPIAGAFSTGENMFADHVSATATSLANGNVVIVGGGEGSPQSNFPTLSGEPEVDIYNSPLPVGAPTLTSVTPSTLTGFNPVTITIQGSGLLPNAFATIDTVPLATTFVSAGEITAVVPQDQLEEFGNRAISANNEGGPSATPPVTILIQNPVIDLELPGTQPEGPPELNFNSVPVGGSGAGLVATLVASGNAPLVFGPISITGTNPGDFFVANGAGCPPGGGTLQPSTTCIIGVGFIPAVTGVRNAQLSVTSNSLPNPVTLPLIGTGTSSPNVAFSPNSLTFANQQVGSTSQPQTITVTSSGDLPLTIGSISFSSPGNFSQTNNCPSTLQSLATCTMSVSFTPSATGALSALIVVGDNAPRGQTFTVALSGTGTNLSIAPASGGSSSASINAGQSAAFSLQASPSGFTGALTLTVNCSAVPESTCAASPNPIVVSPAAPTSFGVSVSTTAHSATNPPGVFFHRTDRPGFVLPAFALAAFLISIVGGLLSARLLTLQVHRNGHRHVIGARIACAVAAAFLLATLAGCASGGSSTTGATSTTPSSQGTPSGTYTVTVTAQGQGALQTLSLSLVVK